MVTSIRGRVGILLGALACFVGLASLFALWLNSRVLSEAERTNDDIFPRALLLEELRVQAGDIHILALEYLQGEVEEETAFLELAEALPRDLNRLAQSHPGRREQAERVADLLGTYASEVKSGVFDTYDPSLHSWAQERTSDLTANEAKSLEDKIERLETMAKARGAEDVSEAAFQLLDETQDLARNLEDHVDGKLTAQSR